MKTSSRTFLVTGGAGFIGSSTVEHLLKEGYKVSVLDNFSTGSRENLDFSERLDSDAISRLTVFEGDIRNIADVRKAIKGAEYVIHEAALTSVQQSVTEPLLVNSVNVDGFLNCLVAAKESGVKRVVLASSSSVYGNTQELPNRESAPRRPESPYAVTKAIGEEYCAMFSSVYGLETVILRYFNVFGPRQNADSEYSAVIPAFIRKFLLGESPTVFGDGEQTRDFTYVETIVNANRLACITKGISGGIFNIASGERTSLNDLISVLGTVTGSKSRPVYSEPRPCDVKHSWADVTRGREALGIVSAVKFDEGVRRTVAYFETGARTGKQSSSRK